MKAIYTLWFCLSIGLIVCEKDYCKTNCYNCATDGISKWCLSCFKAEHKWPSATEGTCSGSQSPIQGCLVSQQQLDGQKCLICDIGHIRNPDYTCAKLQIAHSTHGILSGGEEVTLGCEFGYLPSDDKKSCVKIRSDDLVIELKGCVAYNKMGCSFCGKGYSIAMAPKVGSFGEFKDCVAVEDTKNYLGGCADQVFAGKYCKHCNAKNGFYSVGAKIWRLDTVEESIRDLSNAQLQVCTNGTITVGKRF